MRTVSDLLIRAKHSIESGKSSLRVAAEYIAAAEKLGASQRQIAQSIGKSPAWQAKARRQRAAVQAGRHVQCRPRELLVQALGMLGSDDAGERANAVTVVEKQRLKLGKGWDELIIPARR
jgi:hypothetical protein